MHSTQEHLFMQTSNPHIAMKKFIIYVLIFLSIIILLDILFGVICRYLNSHAMGGDTANHYNITMVQTDSILIMGSSRAIHHYDAKVLEDSLHTTVYNCGLDGNGILFQYGRLSLILQRYCPKLIIYDAIYTFDISQGSSAERDLRWLRRWSCNHTLDSLISDISVNEKYKLFSNFYKYNTDFIQMFSDYVRPMQEISYKGYKPLNGVIDYLPENNNDEIVEWSPLKLKYFKKFIDLCKSNDIKLVVVYSPWFSKKTSIPYYRLTELCNEELIPVIDYYGGGVFNDSKNLFKDASHMNDVGAKKFSRDIVHHLRHLLYN